jgi:hypothetical protein
MTPTEIRNENSSPSLYREYCDTSFYTGGETGIQLYQSCQILIENELTLIRPTAYSSMGLDMGSTLPEISSSSQSYGLFVDDYIYLIEFALIGSDRAGAGSLSTSSLDWHPRALGVLTFFS